MGDWEYLLSDLSFSLQAECDARVEEREAIDRR
jgi:hypothetical protein